jgi:multidrug efflux system membrane fusion protein
MQKWAGVAIASATAVTVAATWLIRGGDGETSSGGWPVTKVALAAVEHADAPRAFHGVGELEAARQVELAAEVAGRITRIAFSSGQRIDKGQLLVQLNDAPEQAERLRLRAQLRNAETVLARTRQLHGERVATQEQLDHASAARDMARGELQRIEAVIAQKAVTAPFSGVIGIRRVHEGQYLNAGDAIASLVDAGTLHANFALDEQAVPHLRAGQPVQVRADAWPGRVFEAEVAAIDPLIGASRTVQVQARIPNAERLLQAGMFAKVRVLRQQPTPVLVVPETAVSHSAYGQTVFVAERDERQALSVRRVAVRTGERWQGLVEIESGLNEGERVVVSGQLRLSDGMLVEVVARDALHEEQPVAPVTEDARS